MKRFRLSTLMLLIVIAQRHVVLLNPAASVSGVKVESRKAAGSAVTA
jgi:hypothetical protein